MALIHVNDENFKKEVLDFDGTVLVDFFAQWCAPCRMLAPIMEEIAQGYKVCKIDVDEAPAIAQMFQIQSIPTLMVFTGGRLVNQAVGYMPKEEILKML